MAPPKTIRRLEVVSPVPTDIDVANSVSPLHISEIAESLNLSPKHYGLYGKYKAKILLSALDELEGKEDGYYVVVGGITPTGSQMRCAPTFSAPPPSSPSPSNGPTSTPIVSALEQSVEAFFIELQAKEAEKPSSAAVEEETNPAEASPPPELVVV